ncbi:MAG: amino acid adenylation domain-containing protein, partial [Deltaproteobacteria bacterium]|nr:amino acid adenylation domain-containing protein [Deltaproteobacteria bacterium]
HSLLAIRLQAAIHRAFGVELPFAALFAGGTPAHLAQMLAQASPLPPIHENHLTRAPLSHAQLRLWFLDRFEDGGSANNVPLALRLRGELDAAALEAALHQLFTRHAALRTVVETDENGHAFQVVRDFAPAPLVPELCAQTELTNLMRQEAGTRFNLCEGPLMRWRLLRLGLRDHVLLLTLHHLVCDGWSCGILFRELSELYDAHCAGRAPNLLPVSSVSYIDFTLWQRDWLDEERINGESLWWQRELADIPQLLELPADRVRPEVLSNHGDRVPLVLEKETTAALERVAQVQGVTLFMVLETLWALFLHKYSHADDIVVGSTVSGRLRPEIERTVGLFVNTLPLRHRFTEGSATFNTLLAQTRQRVLKMQAHQEIPFEKLVEDLAPQRSASHTPIFQTMFVLGDRAFDCPELYALDVTPLFPEFDSAKFDLTLSLEESGKGTLEGHLEFSTDLFERASAVRMARHFAQLVQAAVAAPEAPFCELSLSDAAEYEAVTERFNRTQTLIPQGSTLHGLFEAQVACHPQAPALLSDDAQLTYAQLNTRANRLAHQVVEHLSQGEKRIVGICMERGFELVAALLGVLKAGCAYLPLDPSLPAERLHLMLSDAGAAGVIADRTTCGRFEDFRILVPDEAGSEDDEPNLHLAVGESDLAYVIYTSGSTGQPKGVLVEHRSIVNKVVTLPDLLGESCSACALVTASFSFDPFIEQLMLGLHCGQPVRLLDEAELTDPARFWTLIQKYGVRRVDLTPSLALPLFEHLPAESLPLTHLLLGGEAVPHALMQLLAEKTPHLLIFNMYGPTETTVEALIARLDPESERIPIGFPCANCSAYILDENLQPQPFGVPGELHIGGVQVARGYLNRPELTAERFIPNPFGEGRLYKTGDWARRLENGEIEYLCRIDQQVKIRGFRIELGEIEAAIRDFAGVRDVLVNPFGEKGHQRLCAYVVGDCDFSRLRSFLAEKLPDYMIPAAFMNLPALPLTASGKADRKSLPHPET